jgi:4-amino-4-deoxy-L-arabinose transferase-like glycosyltransferase
VTQGARDADGAARWRVVAASCVVLALACAGLFTSLGDRTLWGDEAETALLARNVLRFGVPLVDDGHNRISHLGVQDSNAAGVWTWSPWLDEYVVAASFALFGESAFSARLPFALFGLATIGLLGWLVQRVRGDPELALSTMLLVATSLPFLLHARQCRYYGLVMFAMVWLLVGLWQLLERRRIGTLSIAGALTVLFYSNYVTVPGPVAALAAAALLWREREGLLRGIALGIAGFALLALPWVAYAGLGQQAASLGTSHFAANLVYYASELHFHVVPWIVLAMPLLAGRLLRRERSTTQPGGELLLWVGLLVVAELLLLSVSPFRFFRYLTPLIPPLLFVTALLLRDWLQPAWLRRTALALLCTSNLLAFASLFPLAAKHPPSAPHARLLLSLSKNYEDRTENVVEFLNREAHPSESLAVPAVLPTWLLPTSPSAVAARPPLALPSELVTSHRKLQIPVRASARGGGRPDPHAYEFFTAKGMEEQVLYRARR